MATYNFPTDIKFGVLSREMIPDLLKKYSVSRPMFVTDGQLVKLPVFTNFLEEMKKVGVEPIVFSGVNGNPVKTQVEEGAQHFKKNTCDGVVAFGGGAAMDVAKCIVVAATHSDDLFAYEDIEGAKPIDDSLLFPIVAVPTTAGTGSEVGRSAVVSDDTTHRKAIIFSPGLLPRSVILDPELQLGLPAAITATTGMDALTHCIEAFLVDMDHPMCDGIALEGIYQVSKSLEAAYEFAKSYTSGTTSAKQEHIEARGKMMNAAMMGAVAFQKGLGVNHSCAHALSTVGDLHHGLANAIMLPHSLLFNLERCPEKFKRMALTVGAGDKGLSFIKWVEKLNEKIGIPQFLDDTGVHAHDVPKLVEVAMNDACRPFNPKPVVKEDFEMLFQSAFKEFT